MPCFGRLNKAKASFYSSVDPRDFSSTKSTRKSNEQVRALSEYQTINWIKTWSDNKLTSRWAFKGPVKLRPSEEEFVKSAKKPKSFEKFFKEEIADGNDTIKGSNSSDVLLGWGGCDTLEGNDGNDVLIGGKGKNSLKGGKGKDLFVVTDLDFFSLDSIVDFEPGTDALMFKKRKKLGHQVSGKKIKFGEISRGEVYYPRLNIFLSGDADSDIDSILDQTFVYKNNKQLDRFIDQWISD